MLCSLYRLAVVRGALVTLRSRLQSCNKSATISTNGRLVKVGPSGVQRVSPSGLLWAENSSVLDFEWNVPSHFSLGVRVGRHIRITDSPRENNTSKLPLGDRCTSLQYCFMVYRSCFYSLRKVPGPWTFQRPQFGGIAGTCWPVFSSSTLRSIKFVLKRFMTFSQVHRFARFFGSRTAAELKRQKARCILRSWKLRRDPFGPRAQLSKYKWVKVQPIDRSSSPNFTSLIKLNQVWSELAVESCRKCEDSVKTQFIVDDRGLASSCKSFGFRNCGKRRAKSWVSDARPGSLKK